MDQLKYIDINKEDIHKREKIYTKAIKQIKDDAYISFKDLGLIQWNATTGRKINKPIFAKVNLYMVFKFYINLGIVFRDKNKRYYTLEEAEQRIIEYYQENGIDYKIK